MKPSLGPDIQIGVMGLPSNEATAATNTTPSNKVKHFIEDFEGYQQSIQKYFDCVTDVIQPDIEQD